MNDASTALKDAGVSVWLDDLSRELIQGGDLERLVSGKGVVGVTTNPTIFASALAKGDAYQDQVNELVATGADVEKAVFAITTEDVRRACDLLAPVYEATGHLDGKVSIEVDPRMAHDESATLASARQLWGEVSRPNVMIKIPATREGIPAIRDAISEGISVNVTLIFGLPSYRDVMEAYVEGIERAHQAGRDLAEISSVASFFVSRVDTEYDKRLDAIGTDEAKALKGKAAIANARLAYQAYEEVFSTPRWRTLEQAGAKKQRPLWASTGVKNPDYSDTMYVDQLVAANTVNTMPLATLNAVIDHATVTGDTVTSKYDDAAATMDALAGLGISYDDVIATLETEGVDKFEKSWGELLGTVTDELERASAAASGEGAK